jgi:hypothetical protein
MTLFNNNGGSKIRERDTHTRIESKIRERDTHTRIEAKIRERDTHTRMQNSRTRMRTPISVIVSSSVKVRSSVGFRPRQGTGRKRQ